MLASGRCFNSNFIHGAGIAFGQQNEDEDEQV